MNNAKKIMYLNHSQPGSYWWGTFVKYIERFPDVEIKALSEHQPPWPKSRDEVTLDFLKKAAGENAHYDADSFRDMQMAEREGYGAVITTSFGDFGIAEGRQKLSIPCVGMAWANYKKAVELGGKISLLHNHGPGVLPFIVQTAESYGFSGDIVSVEDFKVDVYALAANEEQADFGEWMEIAMPTVTRCVEEKGTKTFIIPCGSTDLAEFAPILNEITMEKYGVPVLTPIDTVVNIAREFIQKKRDIKEQW